MSKNNVKKAYAVVVYEEISDEGKLKNYMKIAPKTFKDVNCRVKKEHYRGVRWGHCV